MPIKSLVASLNFSIGLGYLADGYIGVMYYFNKVSRHQQQKQVLMV